MILVTGATGKTGRCVVQELLAAGARVRALVRKVTGPRSPTGSRRRRAISRIRAVSRRPSAALRRSISWLLSSRGWSNWSGTSSRRRDAQEFATWSSTRASAPRLTRPSPSDAGTAKGSASSSARACRSRTCSPTASCRTCSGRPRRSRPRGFSTRPCATRGSAWSTCETSRPWRPSAPRPRSRGADVRHHRPRGAYLQRVGRQAVGGVGAPRPLRGRDAGPGEAWHDGSREARVGGRCGQRAVGVVPSRPRGPRHAGRHRDRPWTPHTFDTFARDHATAFQGH
jgi:hypothetical protein